MMNSLFYKLLGWQQTLLGVILSVTLWPMVALGQTTPYRIFSEAGTGFFGPGRELGQPDTLSAVRIGLTGPEKTLAGRHLQSGAVLAVEEANQRGGYRGRPYAVVFRPDDGPWGTAAKQVVRLAYEDEVWAILGALDGHRAHLAELISAKAWIPVVTPWASDRSIDYANVPWMFRCMPDDGRQAHALVRYAKHRGYERIVVLTEGKRQARLGWERLLDVARDERQPFAMHIEYDPYHPTSILPRLQNIEADALIVWGHPESVLPLLGEIREVGITAPVLGPSLLATGIFAEKGSGWGDIIVAAPYDLSRDDPELKAFYHRYVEYSGMVPSPIALYAYDAARMILKAIERAGLNRARIRDELAGISFDGLVGRIHFDSLGGNPAEPVLMALKSGEWVCLESIYRNH